MIDVVFTHYCRETKALTGTKVLGPFSVVALSDDHLVAHECIPNLGTVGRIIATKVMLSKGVYWSVKLGHDSGTCYTGWSVRSHQPQERNRSVKRRTILVEDNSV